jgi:hypothetical protein
MEAHVAEAMRLSPRDPLLSRWYFFLGLADLFIGMVDRAVDPLRKSVELNPNRRTNIRRRKNGRLFCCDPGGGYSGISCQRSEPFRSRPAFPFLAATRRGDANRKGGGWAVRNSSFVKRMALATVVAVIAWVLLLLIIIQIGSWASFFVF